MNVVAKRTVLGFSVLLAFVTAIGGLASEPSFAGGQRATIPVSTDQSRSRRDRANFPHNKPKHKTIVCSECHHVTPAEPNVKKFPGHIACIQCHNFAEMAINDFSGSCGVCHTDVPVSKEEAKLYQFPKRAAASDFGIAFSHPSHLKPFARPLAAAVATITPVAFGARSNAQSGGLVTPSCADCHKLAHNVAEGIPEMSLATGHPSCFACHGATAAKPPSMNQCAECHKLDAARAPQLAGVVKGFKHLDHEIDIRRRKKGQPVISGEALCVVCHASARNAARLADVRMPASTTCRECHNGGIGFPERLSAAVEHRLK